MTRVIIDKPTRDRLHQLKEQVELCDDAGESLGQFVPTIRLLSKPEDQCPYTDEELRVFRKEKSGRPLAEIPMSHARRTAGLMGWTGTAELADRFALDAELEPGE